MKEESLLSKKRRKMKPEVPEHLKDIRKISFSSATETSSVSNSNEIQKIFPQTYGRPLLECIREKGAKTKSLRVGVVFSGGQASGGHNVLSGLFDGVKELHKKSELIGFLGGPAGIIHNRTKELTKELIQEFRNTGGFDLIGSGRDKIEKEDQLKDSLKTVNELDLDGLVIVGGDDSNTNAAVLAEYFLQNNCKTTVVGVPKTIDGDLQNEHIEISFGFDTACKTYSEMIGNIERDALSAKKYYHFVKLMGRSASHIALECALKTQPNITLISEEVAAEKKTLKSIVGEIADTIILRADRDKNFGVVLIPEGLIEFIFEMKVLIEELNNFLAKNPSLTVESAKKDLPKDARDVFVSLPEKIQEQLLLDRDPHGNVQVSKIETESLLMDMVKEELGRRKATYKGKFHGVRHFFGYEGRSCMPSNFDANYCYALGRLASLLIRDKKTGYMACVYDLKKPVPEWKAKALPITMLMNLEMRHGKEKPVIKKFLVDLKGSAFTYFKKNRDNWALSDEYVFPGPIQFFGDKEITNELPRIISI